MQIGAAGNVTIQTLSSASAAAYYNPPGRYPLNIDLTQGEDNWFNFAGPYNATVGTGSYIRFRPTFQNVSHYAGMYAGGISTTSQHTDFVIGSIFSASTTSGTASKQERMRVTADGNVLIGRTSVGATGNGHSIRGGDSAIFSRDATGETVQVCRNNSTGDLIQFRRNGTVCGEIVNTGSTTVAYNTSSDYRLKENVVAIADGIERIKELKPSRFNFIAEPGKTVDGFLAHEAQTVVPECATGVKDWVDEEGNPKMQGIDQSKLVPLLTAALQEAITKIETLEAKVAALEAG